MPRISPDEAGGLNVCAFLDMLALSELGEEMLADPATDDGYLIIVGSLPCSQDLMTSYADHPRKLVRLNRHLSSTAAGRYQILSRYWDHYRTQLGLPDFGPESQDRYAIQQIREQQALPLIQAGRFTKAVDRCRNIWASLPGAGYGQHENSLEKLASAYVEAGGKFSQRDRDWYDAVRKQY